MFVCPYVVVSIESETRNLFFFPETDKSKLYYEQGRFKISFITSSRDHSSCKLAKYIEDGGNTQSADHQKTRGVGLSWLTY